MARYSIADAENRLPELIDKARAGEDVALTRDGEVVAELRPSPRPPARRPLTEAEWRRLRARRAARPSLGVDSVTVVRSMRDEEM